MTCASEFLGPLETIISKASDEDMVRLMDGMAKFQRKYSMSYLGLVNGSPFSRALMEILEDAVAPYEEEREMYNSLEKEHGRSGIRVNEG